MAENGRFQRVTIQARPGGPVVPSQCMTEAVTHMLTALDAKLREQHLPFRVHLANKAQDLPDLIRLRAAVYGRHLPGMEAVLRTPEPDDLRPDAVLLVAKCKSDGQLLGAIRLVGNQHRPLDIEHALPAHSPLRSRWLGEVGRLTVQSGPHSQLVSNALYKATFLSGARAGMEHLLIAARTPVDRLYRNMQLNNVLPGQKVKLGSTLGVAHSLFELPVQEAQARWEATQSFFHGFVTLTQHPDIEVDQASLLQTLACQQ
jgi:hypothetical protein